MTKTPRLSRADLDRFTGSENWYRHALNPNVLFTDGAKYVADEGGAYWLLDLIALAQRFKKHVAAAPFQVWKLTVHHDRSATVVCEDGDYNVLHRQPIHATTFPLDAFTLWFANGVIYLPSEH